VLTVAGIDLSFTGTGLATAEGTFRIATAPLEAKLSGTAEYRDRMDRAAHIVAWLEPHLEGHDLAVIEGYAFSSAQGREAAGELNALVRSALDQLEVAWCMVAPTGRSKYATGNGTAGKDLVQQEVCSRLGRVVGSNDEVDAYVIRQMALAAYGMEVELVVPQTHRDALHGVDWPTLVLRTGPLQGCPLAPVVAYKPKTRLSKQKRKT